MSAFVTPAVRDRPGGLSARSPLQRRLAVALVALGLTGCVSSSFTPTEGSESTLGPSELTLPSLGPAAAVSTPSTGGDAAVTVDEIRGLITPTGIPVAVVSHVGSTYLVRSPCGRDVVLRDGDPIGPVSVVLDPGHGGPVDTGAQGPNGLVEATVNLRLAEAVKTHLEERGVSVLLTRTGDYPTTLPVRAALADDVGAAMLVSIHHNSPAANRSDLPGTEVFVQSDSPASERLGGLLYEEVTSALADFDVEWSAAPDAGVLRVLLPEGEDAYGILRRPETPAALIEVGYLANRDEAELFTTDEYIAAASQAIAGAITSQLETARTGSGFGAPPRVFRPARAPGASQCTDPVLE